MLATRRTEASRVFELERRGDALILSPRGDLLGFGRLEISSESQAAVASLTDAGVRALVVDLGRANYFGSELIGFLARLAMIAREGGKPMALCHASPDMRQVLGVLNLDPLWDHFATRRAALRELTRVPLRTRLRPLRHVAAAALAAAVLAACAAGFQHLRMQSLDADCYRDLARVWSRVDALRLQTLSDPRWKVLQHEAIPQVESVIAALERAGASETPARRHLLLAARESLLPMLHEADWANLPHEHEFREEMAQARQEIGDAAELVPASITADAD